MKYVAYIQIENDDYLMHETRLAELLIEFLNQHYGQRIYDPADRAVSVHVHVECPSKRWRADAIDDY